MRSAEKKQITISLPASLNGCLEIAAARARITIEEVCHRIIYGLEGLTDADVSSLKKPPRELLWREIDVELEWSHLDRLTRATRDWKLSISTIFRKILYALLITGRVRFVPGNGNDEYRLQVTRGNQSRKSDCREMSVVFEVMFDTVAGKFEKGPYFPKGESRNSWETLTREYFDSKLGTRQTATSHVFSRPEARLAIFGDGGIVRFESSLPKLLYGNKLASVVRPMEALPILREFLTEHVDGEFPDLGEADYMRIDYCHNFPVGNALPDYVATLGKVSFLKHHRLTDRYGGVEYWNASRRVRVYDKHNEIMEVDKKNIPEARGILRFEVQLRKKSQYLQRRLKEKTHTLFEPCAATTVSLRLPRRDSK